MPNPGKFSWRELMTLDRVASRDYYTKLFGWTAREMDMGPEGPYVVFSAGGEDVAGMMQFEASQGIPTMWMPYVAVDDVDASTARGKELGGAAYVEPRDIPGIGRFAVLADPRGASVAAITFAGGFPPEETRAPRAGEFCFEQLLSPDPASVTGFYEAIFGWTHAVYDMGQGGPYWMFKRGDRDAGGCMAMPPGAAGPSSWLSYVAVGDVDVTAARVTELGGKVLVPPSDIPGVGRFAVTMDPQGATLALFRGAGA